MNNQFNLNDFDYLNFDTSIFDYGYQSYSKELKQAIEEIKDRCNIEIRQAKSKRDKAIEKAIARLM